MIVYDTQTRSMLQTDQQYPSVSNQNKAVQANADGSGRTPVKDALTTPRSVPIQRQGCVVAQVETKLR